MGAGWPTRLCGREFGEEQLGVVRDIARGAAGCSRAEIARQVCVALRWIDERGRSKAMGARVALLRLARAGLVDLPAPRNGNANGRRLQWPDLEDKRPVHGALTQLGPVELELVGDPQQSQQWNGLIARYHYLGSSALSGAQLRYLIRCPHGVLGAIGFGAAAWKVRGRDAWIGWNAGQRARQLGRVVNNRRFVILPWVRVPNLASHVLAQAAPRCARDYERVYAIRPLLLETFVESPRYRGTCYQAANWIHLGETQGRGRNDRTHAAPLARKQLYVYPLQRNFRRVLVAG